MDLNAYRTEFPITENYAFLSHAATVRGRELRLAPHFYNTVEEMLRVSEVLGDR